MSAKKSLAVAQVYVIQNELGLIKIGFAHNINSRIESIANNSGLKIVTRHVSPPCFNYADVEKQLHQQFSYARKHGEWFDMSFDEAVNALKSHFPYPSNPEPQKALEPFNFKGNYLRTAIKDDQIWFCLKDACDILEISNSSMVLDRLDSKGVSQADLNTSKGIHKLTFVNEPNLYRVIFRSDKPQAKAFQDWVFEEVLPTIRKTGGYGKTVVTPEFQAIIRSTVAAEVNAAMHSYLKVVEKENEVSDWWIIAMKKVISHIRRGQYPYDFVVKNWKSHGETRLCLLIKLREVIKFINENKLVVERHNATFFRKQLNDAGVIWCQPVHPYINRDVVAHNGKIIKSRMRASNHTALNLEVLQQYGLKVEDLV